MPRFDGTGPHGQGPLTGLGNGPCSPQGQCPFRRRGLGQGRFRQQRGGFLGFGANTVWGDPKMLEETEKALQEELEIVRKEITSQKKK